MKFNKRKMNKIEENIRCFFFSNFTIKKKIHQKTREKGRYKNFYDRKITKSFDGK
jgi:hypothetical protein